MTARNLYEYALIEVNKLEAPSLLLEDYNYFGNKAVQQYINKVYNRYDINQQSTDDLRVLKTTGIFSLFPYETSTNPTIVNSNLLSNSYYTILPKDYLHILNCIVEFEKQTSSNLCMDKGTIVHYSARRLTADMYPMVLQNAYMKPTYKRPYFYINNVNESHIVPTNPSMDNTLDNPSEYRNSNASEVTLEIRCGNTTEFLPTKVYVDYIKSPMFIKLTQSQIDNITDTSQVLEFPDYVCFEIVNEFVKLIMENASDPRIQSNPVVNQTIATGVPQEQQKN